MADYKNTVDFIKSVYGNQEFTPLAVPVFVGNEKKYLNECIDTTFVSSVGKFVDRFEEDMAKYTDAKKAVVCVSGTNALHMALQLVGVKKDDEVLTQALTFIATCNALSYIGSHAVFLDVDRSTMGLSPDAMKAWLQKNAEVRKNTRIGELDKSFDFAYQEDELACYNKNTGRRIKACVPMHSFGHPVRIEEIAALCAEWHIELVEDAAESIGSTYKGKHTGTFGKVGAISFNGNKTITTGGGGMLLFNDEEFGAYAKHITTQAKISHRWEFRHDHVGYNYRMPNINAALGCAQLENLDKYVASKRKVAAKYEVPCILMHNRENIPYKNLMKDVMSDLIESIDIAMEAGVKRENIILDPGIGFAKTYEENLIVMNNLDVIKRLELPILLGTSRKSMIGNALDLPVDKRVEGTVATTVIGIMKGCEFIRVHDVLENKRAAVMTDKILSAK